MTRISVPTVLCDELDNVDVAGGYCVVQEGAAGGVLLHQSCPVCMNLLELRRGHTHTHTHRALRHTHTHETYHSLYKTTSQQ